MPVSKPCFSAVSMISCAVHPFDPNWKLPVYVANFVLMEYGTGAIFGCPAHDQRDLDFVNKYGLGNTPVVCPPDVDPAMKAPTPKAGNTPVIPPPGSPGGNPSIQPK